jgi:hypothetical protein
MNLIRKWQNLSELVSVILLGGYVLVAGIIRGWEMQSDFPNYYTSSLLLVEGAEVSRIYDNTWFAEQLAVHGFDQPGKFIPFPPPTALLMVPLTPFDPLSAKRIWLLMNVLLLIPTVFFIRKISGERRRVAWLLLLATGLGLANNFFLGQVYLLLLLALFAGYHLIMAKKEYAGAGIWGVAAAIKLIPVIFLLPFIIQKKWKLLAGFMVGFVAIHLLTILLTGREVYATYFSVLANHLNGSIEGQSAFAYQFQSWNALLRNLFVYDAVQNPHPLINLAMLFQVGRSLIYAVVIAMAAKLVYDFRKHGDFAEMAMSVAGIAVFELLPASATYHFILLLFPFLFLYRRATGDQRTALFLSFAAIGTLPVILQKLIPQSATVIFLFYRLWLMTIFWAAAMVVFRRLSKEESVNR